MQDRVGEKHGRWTIKSHLPRSKVLVECECGTVKTIALGSITSKRSLSCGCLRGEQLAAKLKMPDALEPHLVNAPSNSLYSIWLGIKTRCYNEKHPSYQAYGKRGILMHEEWIKDFRAFASYLGPRPKPEKDFSVDRIDPKKGYEPGNIRWASRVTQAENRNNNPFVIYEGSEIRLRELAESKKLNKMLLMFNYVVQGKNIEDAVRDTKRQMAGEVLPMNTALQGFTSFIDYTGQQRGPWQVLSFTGRLHKTAPSMWLCRRDDGKVKVVSATRLKKIELVKSKAKPQPTADIDWI